MARRRIDASSVASENGWQLVPAGERWYARAGARAAYGGSPARALAALLLSMRGHVLVNGVVMQPRVVARLLVAGEGPRKGD